MATISHWVAYDDLAWVDTVLGSPEEYTAETELYVRLVSAHARTAPPAPATLLHLGCGAGGNDFTFKRHFAVTGVDLSPGMLQIARRVNPEVTYVLGDMRTIALPERFDAVVIPDSIDYMVTLDDLRATVANAGRHLHPGGVLLLVANTRDDFRDNNFAYTGARGDVEVTVFENDRTCADGARYEATLVYLIRRKGVLSIETEVHTLGLFPRVTWLAELGAAGFVVARVDRKEGYEKYLLGEGEYIRQVFIGVKATASGSV